MKGRLRNMFMSAVSGGQGECSVVCGGELLESCILILCFGWVMCMLVVVSAGKWCVVWRSIMMVLMGFYGSVGCRRG